MKWTIPFEESDTMTTVIRYKIGNTMWLEYNNREATEESDYAIAPLYDSTYTDNAMIEDWVVFNGSTINYLTDFDASIPNFKIRINEDKTISLFYKFRVARLQSDNLQRVEAIYYLHSFVLQRLKLNVQNDTTDEEYDYKFDNNELTQPTRYTYGSYGTLDNYAKTLLHNTYQKGLLTATTSISCSDYYYDDGNLAKEWANGEIIKVGDIVRIDSDNNGTSASHYGDGEPRLWRVSGRKFRYAGVPMIDLELQELKRIS